MLTTSEAQATAKGMTVRQLIHKLADYPPDMPVVMHTDEWYTYIDGVTGPVNRVSEGWDAEYSGYSVPTLIPGVPFDARDV